MDINSKDYQAMTQLALKARELQNKLREQMEALNDKEFNSITEMGNIKVKMYGDYRVISVNITPTYLSTRTSEQISEGITNAFNNCRQAIESEKEELGKKYSEESNNLMKEMMTPKTDEPNGGNIPDGENKDGNV